MSSEGTNYNQHHHSVDPSHAYPSGGTTGNLSSHNQPPSLPPTDQGSQSYQHNMPYSQSGGMTGSTQQGSSGAVPMTPYGNSLPPLTSPYMMGHFHTVGMDSSADTPSAYFMSPSYPLQAPRSILKPKMEPQSGSDRRYHENTNASASSTRDPSASVGPANQNMNRVDTNSGTQNGQFPTTHSQTNANSISGGKEELPRRILQFEPSPSQHGNPSAQSIDTKSQGHKDSSSPNKMSPLDGSHRTLMERYGHQQSYESSHGYQAQYDFYNPAGASGNRNQNHGQYPMQTSQRLPGSSVKKTTFSPHISNAFDGMPFVDFHPNSDTKFDELMISPAVGMSSRGGRAGGNMRRTTYDLHDNPSFNIDHGSPMSIRKNNSATRYCTPIVTGGNDRSRVASAGTYSGRSEQNYRPSPPSGMSSEYDSHLRHYHRPYPTIRGDNPSPVRFDTSAQPDQHYGISPSMHFQTPVIPRSYQESGSGSGRSDQNSGRSQQTFPDPSRNFHPHHRVPPQPHMHPAQSSYPHPAFPPGYPYPFHGASGTPMHSPYDGQYMPFHYPPQVGRKRKSEPRKQPVAKDSKKKKMYSDWVGVTFNRTHKKYQACITHYRKQHYLGRYMLAVDAAKAYDMAARELKGAGWKVNFEDDGEYCNAKEKELQKHFTEKNATTEEEKATVRRMFEAVHPTVQELREKLGVAAPANVPMHVVPREGMTYSMLMQNQKAQHFQARNHNSMPMPPVPIQHYPSSMPRNHQIPPFATQYAVPKTTETAHGNSALGLAVTPSPNVQAINKQLPTPSPNLQQMTPDARLAGMSPSAEMTPMSSDSLKGLLMPSTVKAKVDNRQSDEQALKGVQKDIFSSPTSNDNQVTDSSNNASTNATDKNAAASALLMIGQ